MKRRLSVGFSLAMCLVLIVSIVASAGSTTKNLVTNFTLSNLSTTDATGSITYYKEDGTAWTGSGYTSFGPGQAHELPGNGGQLVVRQYSDTLAAGRGSVMVTSNVAVSAVVQERLAPGDTALPTSGAYVGFTEGSSLFYLPLVQKNRSTSTGIGNSQIMVQNTGSAVIPLVDINLVAEPGSGSLPATYTKSISNLAAGATFFYDLADDTNITNGWNGSAEVDAHAGKVAVVSNSFNGANALRTYNGFPVESIYNKWAIPLFASQLTNGLNTSVSVQNLGAEIPVGDLVLDCGAFTKSNATAIPTKGTYGFNPINGVPSAYPTNWQGACTITAPGNVVAFVIMRRITGNGDQAAYEALSYASTDTNVFIPLMAKRLPNGFATSAVVQNLSSSSAFVDVIWTHSATECLATPCNDYTVPNVEIPGNGNMTLNLRVTSGGGSGIPAGLPDGWQGTVKVIPHPSTTARPLVGYVVLSSLNASAGDNYRAHRLLTLP